MLILGKYKGEEIMRFVSGFLALFFSFNSYGDFEYYKCNDCAPDQKMAIWTGPLTEEAVIRIHNLPYFELSYPEFAEDSTRKTEFIFLSMRYRYAACMESYSYETARKKESSRAEIVKYAIENCIYWGDRRDDVRVDLHKKVKGGFWRLYRDEINYFDGIVFNGEPERSILKDILERKSAGELISFLATEDWKTELSYILPEIIERAKKNEAEQAKFKEAIAERLDWLKSQGLMPK